MPESKEQQYCETHETERSKMKECSSTFLQIPHTLNNVDYHLSETDNVTSEPQNIEQNPEVHVVIYRDESTMTPQEKAMHAEHKTKGRSQSSESSEVCRSLTHRTESSKVRKRDQTLKSLEQIPGCNEQRRSASEDSLSVRSFTGRSWPVKMEEKQLHSDNLNVSILANLKQRMAQQYQYFAKQIPDNSQATVPNSQQWVSASSLSGENVISPKHSQILLSPMASSTPVSLSRKKLMQQRKRRSQCDSQPLVNLENEYFWQPFTTHSESGVEFSSPIQTSLNCLPSLMSSSSVATTHFTPLFNQTSLSASPGVSSAIDVQPSSSATVESAKRTVWHNRPETPHQQLSFRTDLSKDFSQDSGIGFSLKSSTQTQILTDGELNTTSTTSSSWATSEDSSHVPMEMPNCIGSQDESNAQAIDEMNESLTTMGWLDKFSVKEGLPASNSKPQQQPSKKQTCRANTKKRGHCVCDEEKQKTEPSAPSCTYKDQIIEALKEVHGQCMTVRQIRDHLVKKYPFYEHHQECKFWKEAIQHNLSSNACFQKLDGPEEKRHFWTLDLTKCGSNSKRSVQATRPRSVRQTVKNQAIQTLADPAKPVVLKRVNLNQLVAVTSVPASSVTTEAVYSNSFTKPGNNVQSAMLNKIFMPATLLPQHALVHTSPADRTILQSSVAPTVPMSVAKVPIPPISSKVSHKKKARALPRRLTDSGPAPSGQEDKLETGHSGGSSVENILLQAAITSGVRSSWPSLQDELSLLQNSADSSARLSYAMTKNPLAHTASSMEQSNAKNSAMPSDAEGIIAVAHSASSMAQNSGKLCSMPRAQSMDERNSLDLRGFKRKTSTPTILGKRTKFSSRDVPSLEKRMPPGVSAVRSKAPRKQKLLCGSKASEMFSSRVDHGPEVPCEHNLQQKEADCTAVKYANQPSSQELSAEMLSGNHNSSQTVMESPSSGVSLTWDTFTPLGKMKVVRQSLPSPNFESWRQDMVLPDHSPDGFTEKSYRATPEAASVEKESVSELMTPPLANLKMSGSSPVDTDNSPLHGFEGDIPDLPEELYAMNQTVVRGKNGVSQENTFPQQSSNQSGKPPKRGEHLHDAVLQHTDTNHNAVQLTSQLQSKTNINCSSMQHSALQLCNTSSQQQQINTSQSSQQPERAIDHDRDWKTGSSQLVSNGLGKRHSEHSSVQHGRDGHHQPHKIKIQQDLVQRHVTVQPASNHQITSRTPPATSQCFPSPTDPVSHSMPSQSTQSVSSHSHASLLVAMDEPHSLLDDCDLIKEKQKGSLEEFERVMQYYTALQQEQSRKSEKQTQPSVATQQDERQQQLYALNECQFSQKTPVTQQFAHNDTSQVAYQIQVSQHSDFRPETFFDPEPEPAQLAFTKMPQPESLSQDPRRQPHHITQQQATPSNGQNQQSHQPELGSLSGQSDIVKHNTPAQQPQTGSPFACQDHLSKITQHPLLAFPSVKAQQIESDDETDQDQPPYMAQPGQLAYPHHKNVAPSQVYGIHQGVSSQEGQLKGHLRPGVTDVEPVKLEQGASWTHKTVAIPGVNIVQPPLSTPISHSAWYPRQLLPQPQPQPQLSVSPVIPGWKQRFPVSPMDKGQHFVDYSSPFQNISRQHQFSNYPMSFTVGHQRSMTKNTADQMHIPSSSGYDASHHSPSLRHFVSLSHNLEYLAGQSPNLRQLSGQSPVPGYPASQISSPRDLVDWSTVLCHLPSESPFPGSLPGQSPSAGRVHSQSSFSGYVPSQPHFSGHFASQPHFPGP